MSYSFKTPQNYNECLEYTSFWTIIFSVLSIFKNWGARMLNKPNSRKIIAEMFCQFKNLIYLCSRFKNNKFHLFNL